MSLDQSIQELNLPQDFLLARILDKFTYSKAPTFYVSELNDPITVISFLRQHLCQKIY